MSKGFEVIKNTALLFVYNTEREYGGSQETLTNKKNLLSFSIFIVATDWRTDKFVRKIGERNIGRS